MDINANIIQKYLMQKFWLSICVFLTPFLHASVVEPGDGPYYRYLNGPILYVYDPATTESIPQVVGYMQAIRGLYDSSFNWRLDEREDLVLTSSAQQVANAYATVIPNIKSVWFPSGAGMLESMAESSWFLALATHETSHLYQLNAKGPLNAEVKKYFGNTEFIFPFFPIVIHPNILTPTFLIEGNAVFNESRANLGGRLHSGEVRALVLAQIKARQIDPERLINNEFHFPYNETAYMQGGYFQAHLATKYGVDKTNQFFLSQGDHYIWPLILNDTFRSHFGDSYPQEIREYVREMEGLAKNQSVSDGPDVTRAQFISPLNHDSKSIFFLTSDGLEPAKLFTFNKADQSLRSRQLDLPVGKVFWPEGAPLVADSEQHDLHRTEYSLYGEGHSFDPKYRGQIVSDQRAAKTAALDAKNSWLEGRVLINGETYDIAHSMPILDESGNVYYFRQNGGERILYKNREPVFKYEGFYGKLTEVTDGGIYFIANTDYGSSLYRYSGHEISRVLKSDRVVDARQIDARNFLAVEVGADGHRAVVAQADPAAAQPAVYSYGFPSYNLAPAKIPDVQQVEHDQRDYNSFSELRYSGLDFSMWSNNPLGLGALFNATFADPLEYQALSFGGSGTVRGSQTAQAQYKFTKYLLQPWTYLAYEKEYWNQSNGIGRFSNIDQELVGFTLPLLRWRDWDAAWDLAALHSRIGNHGDPSGSIVITRPVDDTYGVWNSARISFSELGKNGLGFYPWRNLTLSYANKLLAAPGTWTTQYNTSAVQLQYQHGFHHEFYATLAGGAAWAVNHDISLSYNPAPLLTDTNIQRLAPHDYYAVKTASVAHFEFTKVFPLSGYSTRIPIGLMRLAPVVIAQGIFLDDDGNSYGHYPANIFEWGYGADADFLMLHLGVMRVRLMLGVYDTRDPRGPYTQFQLSTHLNF